MKILIASVPGQTGIDDAIAAEAQVLTYCPTAITEKAYFDAFGGMDDAVAYAIANGFDGIARNSGGFDVEYAQAAVAKAVGIWISWAHGANTHTLISSPDHLVDKAIGVGKGTAGVNAASYGPALDFFVDGAANESQACGAVAGRVAQLLIDNPTFSFENARNLLRKNSTNFPDFAIDGGYGSVNLGEITVEKIDTWTPATPTTLTGVRSGDNTSAALSWDAQADATSSKVYRSETMDGTFVLVSSPASNSYNDTALNEKKSYCYKAAAYNSESEQESALTASIIVNSHLRVAGDMNILAA